MFVVRKVVNGGFNVIGTNDDGVCVQGHLTLAELMDLRDEIQQAIDEEINEGEDD